MQRITVLEIYDILLNHFGTRNWWPAETRFEIIIGSFLTQNTNWLNVESAIKNLKKLDCMTPQAIASLHIRTLEKAVYPARYYRQKARRLKNFSNYLMKNHNGDLDKLFSKETNDLRAELLNQNGIGPETADSIILYAGEKPIFVIDAYTKRFCERLNLTKAESYDDLQEFFMNTLPIDVQLYNEYHALIVEFCRTTCTLKPNCKSCILNKYCKFRL